jgi:PTS system mannose-specific IIA component
MIGVLLLSHGEMAEGMLDACKLFFGDDIPNIKALCLKSEDDPVEFDERIKEAVEQIDDGSGVVALVDLLGGTPSNRSMFVLNERMQVITGMNLTILLELMGKRFSAEDVSEIDVEELVKTGQKGIASLNKLMK